MCVALVLVLGDRINVSRERKAPWFYAYIGTYKGIIKDNSYCLSIKLTRSL